MIQVKGNLQEIRQVLRDTESPRWGFPHPDKGILKGRTLTGHPLLSPPVTSALGVLYDPHSQPARLSLRLRPASVGDIDELQLNGALKDGRDAGPPAVGINHHRHTQTCP
jgi:hypothetical protein